ncbi:hypothetical protein D3C76_855690 [compost metagenome]
MQGRAATTEAHHGAAAVVAHLTARYPAIAATLCRYQGGAHRVREQLATAGIGAGTDGQGLRVAGQGIAAVVKLEVIDRRGDGGGHLVIDGGGARHKQGATGRSTVDNARVIHVQCLIGIYKAVDQAFTIQIDILVSKQQHRSRLGRVETPAIKLHRVDEDTHIAPGFNLPALIDDESVYPIIPGGQYHFCSPQSERLDSVLLTGAGEGQGAGTVEADSPELVLASTTQRQLLPTITVTDVTITARTAQEAVIPRGSQSTYRVSGDGAEPTRAIGIVARIQRHARTLIRGAKIQGHPSGPGDLGLIVLGQCGIAQAIARGTRIAAVTLGNGREIEIVVYGLKAMSHARQ